MKKYLLILISIAQIITALYVISNINEMAVAQEQAFKEGMKLLDETMASAESELYEIQAAESGIELSNENLDEDMAVTIADTSNEDDFISNYNFPFDIDIKDLYIRLNYITSFVVIIFALITVEYASKDLLSFHKRSLIVFSVLTILMGINGVSILLAIVSLITAITLEKDTSELAQTTKKITPVEYEQNTTENKKKALIAVGIYVLLYIILPELLSRVDWLYESIAYSVLAVIFIVIIFVSIFFLYKEEIKIGFKAIKENPRGYKYFIFKRLVLAMLLVAVANVARFLITQNVYSENQSALAEISILSLAPLAVVFAPLVEEAVFRGTFRKFINNKYIFAIISGIVFGFIHATSETGVLNIIVTTIPYALMGYIFALSYYKSNNIVSSMCMHALNNLISVIIMFIAFGF